MNLRPFDDSDAAALVALISEPAVLEWWGPHTEQDLREEFADDKVRAWVIEVDGQTAGLIQATEETDPGWAYVELDLFVGNAHQGRGIGREAIRAVLHEYFEGRGHHRAIIQPAAANERAIRCYSSVGFQPVGIFRQADRGRDSLAMDLLKEELA